MESADFHISTTSLKHPNDRWIVKLSFKKRIHKSTSLRKLYIILYSLKYSEFSVSFFANSINISIKFKFTVNDYRGVFRTLSNMFDEEFQIYLTAEKLSRFSQKSLIIDVLKGPKLIICVWRWNDLLKLEMPSLYKKWRFRLRISIMENFIFCAVHIRNKNASKHYWFMFQAFFVFSKSITSYWISC